MMKAHYSRLESVFDSDHVIYWSNLSRSNNLMVIVNISMFFLTGLVAKGYFYTLAWENSIINRSGLRNRTMS